MSRDVLFARALREQTWTLVALATPRVLRHCPRCGEDRLFRSSDRFRVNAQKRRHDVWLVYRCTSCDRTWNCEVRSRALLEELGDEALRAYLDNDRTIAWACAFDRALLERAGARAEFDVPYRVERSGEAAKADALRIRFALAHPCAPRLERVLAKELGCSRAALAAALEEGRLTVEPATRHALRRPVVPGQRVTCSLGSDEGGRLNG